MGARPFSLEAPRKPSRRMEKSGILPPMSTIALALHEPAAHRVRDLWAELEARFGLAGVRKVPFPHVTLLGFDGLGHGRVKALLETISQATPPLALRTAGLGLFGDPARILYAPVVKSPGLHDLHQQVLDGLARLGADVYRLYQPEWWVPHVTLAQGDPVTGSYGEAVEYLLREDLRLTFEVRNLTLFDWIGPRYEPCERFPLMGRVAAE